MMTDNLAVFEKQNYLNLETFRKNGEGVKTPVWFMRSGDVLYIRTVDNSGKVKRIRRNPQVRIAPCKGNGSLLGDWLEASAEVVKDPQIDKEAEKLADRKYGLMKKLFELFSGLNRQAHITLQIRLQ